MKKTKHGRKIGYGLAGLTIGFIVYLFLQSGIPAGVEVGTTLADFPNKEEDMQDIENDYVLDDENYSGDIMFYEYDSYHVSNEDLIGYQKSHIVRYGKVNPTFYFDRGSLMDEESEENSEEEGNNETNNDNSEKEDDSNQASDDKGGTMGGNIIEGFNIHTRKREEGEVSHIIEQFKEYGEMPLDKEHINISSEYGERIDPFAKIKAYHVGLDYSTSTIDGANIYSVLDGEVKEVVEKDSGLGNYVVVEHDGFETLYAHMKEKSTLNVGDKVYAGDIVGYVGTTGRSTGPHLHLEVGIGGLKFDPQVFINEIGKVD